MGYQGMRRPSGGSRLAKLILGCIPGTSSTTSGGSRCLYAHADIAQHLGRLDAAGLDRDAWHDGAAAACLPVAILAEVGLMPSLIISFATEGLLQVGYLADVTSACAQSRRIAPSGRRPAFRLNPHSSPGIDIADRNDAVGKQHKVEPH
jgi:hypothetical protein